MKKGFGSIFVLVIVLTIAATALIIYRLSSKTQPNLGLIIPSLNKSQVVPTNGEAPVGGLKIAGIMGAYESDFATIKGWGGNAVHIYKYPGSTIQIGHALSSAKGTGLYLMASVTKINQFNNAFDLASLNSNPSKYLPDLETVAGDSYFLGYWLIDEPCNSKKRSPVQAQDFDDLYKAVKAINSKVPIVINFGTLECLEGFVNESKPGLKLTDVAMFTITEKKLMQMPSYIADQAAIAKQAKAFDPTIKIIPQIQSVGLKEKGTNLPSASWIQSTGLETARHLDVFDGILYYSFHSFDNINFIGASISTIQNNPDYTSAFKTVFSDTIK